MNGQEIRHTTGRTQVRAARAIGYVRVSQVGGRGGANFISPDVQRSAIAAKVSEAALELVALEEDMDKSSRNNNRPGLERTLEAIEAGEASVVIVAYHSRFARSMKACVEALERIEAAGGRLIACDADIDPTTPAGRFTRSIMFAMAAFESDRIQENWRIARTNATARGVKIASRANYGYRFDAEHRLEGVPGEAAVVVELFRRRAAGASWPTLLDFLEENGAKVSPSQVGRMIRNRVYLGEARVGELVNTAAHEAIVPLELFEAANARRGTARRYDPAVRSMLAGIARCGSCGARMRRGGRDRNGQGTYTCRNRECRAQASVLEPKLDALVGDLLLRWAGEQGISDVQVEASRPAPRSPRAELEQALADAELALHHYLTSPEYFGVEPALHAAGARARQARLEELRIELDELGDADHVDAVRSTLREAWPNLDAPKRRLVMDGVVDRVVVERSNSAKRGAQPIGERVRVILTDGTVLVDRAGEDVPQIRKQTNG